MNNSTISELTPEVCAQIKETLKVERLAGEAIHSSYVTVFNEIEALDAAADQAWEDLPDRKAYDAYRMKLRDRLMKDVGAFPERTPLNAKVVTSLKKDGYRINKVLFESIPGIFVSAYLFLPDSPEFTAPYPAVVISCGHSATGKDSLLYSHAAVLAARGGLAALIFDPYEQGERRQSHDIGLCQGHDQIGQKATLLGRSMAMFRLWDGIRAVDYVETRPEIDKNRIGYMGNSGGGTMTSLMNAIDLRLKATVPSCYLTTFTSLCEHLGPQDAEQNVFGQLADGVNHTSLVLIPDSKVAVCCKFSDFFTYYGTKRLFRLVKSVAAKLGTEDHYAMIDVPGPHGWTEGNESASVDWLRAWLRGEKELLPFDMSMYRARDLGFIAERDGDSGLLPEERGCTPTKSTLDLPGARDAFDVLRDMLADARKTAVLPPRGAERAALVRKLANVKDPEDTKALVKVISRDTAGDYEILHIAFLYPTGLAIPADLVKLRDAKVSSVVISIGRKGRERSFENAAEALREGKAVLVADLTGLGSIGEGRFAFYGDAERSEEGTSVMLYLMGESMIGRRVTDLGVISNWLKGEGFTDISLLAEDEVAITVAHADAAFPELFSEVSLLNPPKPWADAFDPANDGKAPLHYSDIINGALNHYDWPELLD